MQYSAYSFSCDSIEPEDDIDKLFNQLQTIEPPPELITRIVGTILPLSQSLLHFDLDGLFVSKETKEAT
jgi:hypothetical protein